MSGTRWLAGLLPALLLVLRAAPGAGLPPLTEAERAAAFPDVGDVDAHAHDDAINAYLLADQLEWRNGTPEDVAWKVRGWLGRDLNRLWLRARGDKPRGGAGRQEAELFWGRAVSPWWEIVAGLRQDFGAGPSRTYGALGVQGLAPHWVNLELTAYAGESGQAGLALDGDYELLLTNRLILTTEAELAAWRKDDAATGIGEGFSTLKAGLRLRYEFWREFAPYLGLEWEGRFGDTADLAREAGVPVRDTRLLVGLRLWF